MKNIFLEDIAYGVYDRPGPKGTITDSEKEESTVPESVPVVPGNQMSNQLSVERPPIEDDDFVPGNIEELSRAASAISKMVPVSQIEFYYKRLHSLLDDATDRDGTQELEDNNKPDEDNVQKESLEKKINRVLKEILTDKEKSEFEEFRAGEKVDYFGEFEPDPEPEQIGLSLEDIAEMFGYSSASGARQEIKKITDRLNYFVTKVDYDDLESLIKYATGEFVDTLAKGDFIDPEDAEDLRKAPATWFREELPSFGFFFVSAFVLPAYREVARNATKKVRSGIADLGIPKELEQTVFNQITGAATRKPAIILKKLEALIKKGEIKREDLEDYARNISQARARLVADAELEDDFIQRALDKWQKSSKGARIKAVRQALENTAKG